MRTVFYSTVALTLCCFVPTASAAMIELSTYSNDQTPPSLFDATLQFTVTDNTLTLAISNNTAEPNEYNIRAAYFNVLNSSNVTGLSLASAPVDGWLLATSQKIGGFGTFDYGLLGGNSPHQVSPATTETFTFEIAGTGPFFDTDFTTEHTADPTGSMPPMLAAAKFFGGPSDDSGYGGINTPEPTTAALMAMGCVAIVRRRRR